MFEPEAHGHQHEYFSFVLDALERLQYPPEVHLLISSPLAERGLDWESAKGKWPRSIVGVDLLSEDERRASITGGPWRQGGVRWRILTAAAQHLPDSRWLAMSLDVLQLPLALGRRLPGKSVISGILFRPSIHYASPPGSPSERLRKHGTGLMQRFMLLNPVLEAVFSVDPQFREFALRWSNGAKIHYLPDPVPPQPRAGPPGFLNGRGDGRIRFLLFGALARRKGVLQLLSALRFLSSHEASRTTVVLAGRVEPALAKEVLLLREQASAVLPTLELVVEDRYLEEEELAGAIHWCDVVLAPYQRFVGSSGVLVRAAAAGKPVISQDYGLVGTLVRKYRLGETVETHQPEQIAGAIKAYVAGTGRMPDRSAAVAFTSGRTPADFGNALVSALYDSSGTMSRKGAP